MIELTAEFQEIDLTTALAIAAQPSRILIAERSGDDLLERHLVAVYSDGVEIAWRSGASGHDREEMELEPPTVWVRKVADG